MVMNSRGQGVVEAILILVALLAVSTLVAQKFRQNQLVAQMVSAPWQSLSGMLQNGVWAPPRLGADLHPSNFGATSRLQTLRGRDVR